MRSPSLLFIALVLCLSTGANPRTAPPAEGTQVITLTAKKYEFDPSPIRLKQGTPLQLKSAPADHVHAFKISDVPEGGGQPGLIFNCTRVPCFMRMGDGSNSYFLAV